MRFRFSLRWLLLAFVVAAGFCWWWDRPRRVANSLAAAIDSSDLSAVNQLLDRLKFTGEPKLRIVSRKQSATDWLRGISRLTVSADIGEVMIIELEAHRDKVIRVRSLPDAMQLP